MKKKGRDLKHKFIPIVTTHTLISADTDMASLANDSERLAEGFIVYQRKVGFDCLPIMVDSTYIAEIFGCRIKFADNEPVIEDFLSFSAAGKAADFTTLPFKSLRRIDAFIQAVEKAVVYAAKKDLPVIVNSPGPLSSLGRIIGMENLMLAMASQPDLIKTLLDKVTDTCISFTQALVAKGTDLLFLPEPAASGNLISPSMFNEFAFPLLKRQIGELEMPTILHICGKVDGIIRDMIHTGAVCLSLDQEVDLACAREMAGSDIILGGNIDPVNDLAKKSSEEILNISRQCCRMGRPNFILMPGCTITADTPIENIQAMMEVAERNPGYV